MSLVSLPTSRDESATAATSAAAAAAPAPRGLHLDRTMTVESSSLTKKRPWDDDKDNMDTSSLPSWNASNINTNHVNNDKECPPVSLPSVMVAPTALPAATTAATAATTTTAAQPRLLPTKDPKISVDDEAKRSAIVQLFSESDGPTSPWNAIADGSITTATMAIDKDRAVLRTSFGDTARTTTTTITTRTTINTIDAIVCLEEDQEQDVLHPPDKSITSSHVMTNANGVGDGTDGTTNNADAPTSSFVAATKKSRTQRYEIDTKVKKWFNTDDDSVALFSGYITRYDPDAELYLIHYCDGDEEELEEVEVSSIVVTPSLDRTPRVDTVPWFASTHMRDHCLFATTGVRRRSVHDITGLDRVVARSLDNVVEFFLFVLERQYVHERRHRGDPAPWSVSTVLQRNHWCNNYRELDRGTAYLRAHVLTYGPQQQIETRSHLLRRVLFDSYLYRQINRIETYEETGFPREDDDSLGPFFEKLRTISRKGKVIFTAAHQTTNLCKLEERIISATKKNERGTNLLDDVFRDVLSAKDNRQSIINGLKRLPGVSAFTAWQILCDLQECHCINIDDGDQFCELGPGAKKGLAHIFGSLDIQPSKLANLLVDNHRYVYDKLGLQFPYWRGRPLTIKEIEHALCEFQKFCTIKKSNGATRGRVYYSQQRFDKSDTCFGCHGATTKTETRGTKCCDTCRTFFCYSCYENSPKDVHDSERSWICHRCKSFENRFTSVRT